jgi:tRNA 2-thiouridine synthesizing protein A
VFARARRALERDRDAPCPAPYLKRCWAVRRRSPVFLLWEPSVASKALDLKGLVCPLPVLRANKAMKALAPGDVLEIEVTDPAAPADFRAYCKTAGHELLETREEADVFAIVLRKRS